MKIVGNIIMVITGKKRAVLTTLHDFLDETENNK